MRKLIKRNPQLISASGFTLIELLLVIVIIGILSGVVLAVINPREARQRSMESVLRSSTDKLCTAMLSCASSRLTPATSCGTFDGIGASAPTGIPLGSTYSIGVASDAITVTGVMPGMNASTNCEMSCMYDTTTGLSRPTSANANCLAR